MCQHEREDAKREVKLVRGEIASLEEERQAVLAKVEQIHAAQAARKGPDRLNQRVQDFKHYGRALPILLDTKQVRNTPAGPSQPEASARPRVNARCHAGAVYVCW